MKKVCSILLCASMVFCLCSCGDSEATNTTSEEETETVEITTSEEVEITTEEEKETTILDTETELYNDNGFVISILSVVDNGYETIIDLVFQNNLDVDYDIFSFGIAVNGLCVPSDIYFAETIMCGVKTKVPITISDTWLTDNGISKVSTLSFAFECLDENYNTEWVSNKVTVNTNLYDENAEYTPSCEQVYSDDYVTAWFDNIDDNVITIIIKNNSQIDLNFELGNCAINDWTYDIAEYCWGSDYYGSYYYSDILAGTYAVIKIEVTNDFIDEYSIDTIESMKLTMLYWENYIEGKDCIDDETDFITLTF